MLSAHRIHKLLLYFIRCFKYWIGFLEENVHELPNSRVVQESCKSTVHGSPKEPNLSISSWMFGY